MTLGGGPACLNRHGLLLRFQAAAYPYHANGYDVEPAYSGEMTGNGNVRAEAWKAAKVVDLFCGCGGMSLGFELAGFDVVAGFDNWKAALEVYRANHDHDAIECDLSDAAAAAKAVARYKPDLIIGGPPCQDFSTAGKMSEGGNAVLTVRFSEIVAAVKPRLFVMENVPAIVRSAAYAEAVKNFKDAGYGLTSKVIDASHCGVPQKRMRHIDIGELDGGDGAFDGALSSVISKEPMTLRTYLGEKVPFEHYYRHPTTYKRRGIFSVDEPCPTIRGMNRPMPKTYKRHENDPVDLKGIRGMTMKERANVQTFPDGYEWTGSPIALEKMVGNAVPPLLATKIAVVLSRH